MIPVGGEINMAANVTATTIVATGVFAKIAGTTTLNYNNAFSMPQDNRLLCNCASAGNYRVILGGSIKNGNGNNQDMILSVYKNGVLLINVQKQVTNTSTNQIQSFIANGIVYLKNGDYLEGFIKNNTGTNNPTITYLSLTAILY